MNDSSKKSLKNMPFDEYVLSRIKRMKAMEITDILLRHYKGDKKGKVKGKIYRITEYFKNEEEIEQFDRRQIYKTFEQENLIRYKDGSIAINSLLFVRPYFDEKSQKETIFDVRFIAVANLYPQIMEIYPDYLKQFINPKYFQYKILTEEDYVEVYSKEALDFEVMQLEKSVMKSLEEFEYKFIKPESSQENPFEQETRSQKLEKAFSQMEDFT
ncbi:MAG: hypothetical protein EOM55_00975 [Clostridia bacterium]|nr:hypothetical protein [Clostridia bacterium]